MGITNDLFPNEVCPGGDCAKIAFFNPVPGLQDALNPNTRLRGIDNFENFMKLLGPPPRGPVTDQALEGERVFQAIGCTACHTPALVTGQSPVLIRLNHFNFSFSRSFTTFGFALPFEAFITWPTKNPKSVSLPARYCSNCLGLAAITSSITRSISPMSLT